MNNPRGTVAENLDRLRERLERAALRSDRRADEITLIAVSKTHPAEKIRQLYDAGVRHFGENRVQEWESKRPHLLDLAAEWHMIGHLQSNKAARAVCLFNSVDSVDSSAVAEKLDRAKRDLSAAGEDENKNLRVPGKENSARLAILIEVKLDPGATKTGVQEEELPRLVESVLRLPHLQLRGLMGVPPYFDNPEEARPYFRRLRELRDSLRARLGRELLPVLSMGMSHDFEVAIKEGATEIRVGTALFGERPRIV